MSAQCINYGTIRRTSKVAASALDGVLTTSLKSITLCGVVVGVLAVGLSNDILDWGRPVDVVRRFLGYRYHGRLVRHGGREDVGGKELGFWIDGLRRSFVYIRR